MPAQPSTTITVKPDHLRVLPCLLRSLRLQLSLGHLCRAIDVLPLLAHRGLRPDSSTLATLLHECLRAGDLRLARRVHLFLRLTGLLGRTCSLALPLANHLLTFHFMRGRPADARQLFERMPAPNVYSSNAMLIGYSRLGLLRDARRVFDRMPHRDIVSWNTMILSFARAGSFREAFEYYSQLRSSSIGYSPYTFSSLLVACVRLEDFHVTRQVHAQVLIVNLLASNIIISSSLVDAYCRCGCLENAHKLFDEMPIKDVLVWTTLVHGYAKSGDIVSARRLFDAMPEKNPISWTALIGGYARHGYANESLDLFRNMMESFVRPDQFTFSSTLCACTAINSLKHGKQIHARLLRTHFKPNAILLSSLIDMYSKCGDIEACRRIFALTESNRMDPVLWNTMMSALGRHGQGLEAIAMLEHMISSEVKPDENTFIVLLTSCSHSGLVEEGMQLFESMIKNHGVVPQEDHYVCLVDLLGRAGHFGEVMKYLSKEPCRSSIQAWSSLLGACRIHGDVQLGKIVAQRIIKLGPQFSSAYLLLSNFSADFGRWTSVEKVRCHMDDRGMKKQQGSSWVEIKDMVHSVDSL